MAGYEAGKSMKDTAEFDINRATVSSHLRHARIPIRGAGLDEEQAGETARLYEAGWSSCRLAEQFAVSADTILKVVRRAGVEIRPRRGGPRPTWTSPHRPNPSPKGADS